MPVPRIVAASAITLLLALAGCGDDDAADQVIGDTFEDQELDGADAPPCREVYAPGSTVPTEAIAGGCRTDDVPVTVPDTGRIECTDGRVLYWNDFGWWFDGEPVNAHDDPAELAAPEDVREECEG